MVQYGLIGSVLEEIMDANLKALHKELDAALAAKDAEKINLFRSKIGDQFPTTPEGAEANFRLGVSLLMAGQAVDDAIERLRRAAKAKQPTWTAQARLSLGLLLKAQGREQQAMFELRKVAGGKTQDLAAAQAYGFMLIILEDGKKNDEAQRTRKQYHSLLEKLVEDEDEEISCLAHFMFGMDLKFHGNRKEARKHLELAQSKNGLQPEQAGQVEKALEQL